MAVSFHFFFFLLLNIQRSFRQKKSMTCLWHGTLYLSVSTDFMFEWNETNTQSPLEYYFSSSIFFFLTVKMSLHEDVRTTTIDTYHSLNWMFKTTIRIILITNFGYVNYYEHLYWMGYSMEILSVILWQSKHFHEISSNKLIVRGQWPC